MEPQYHCVQLWFVYGCVTLHSPYGVRSTSPVVRTLALVRLVPERHTLVREARLGPAQREAVELLEAPALEGVADDRDVRGVRARELAEAREREEHVLVRVQRAGKGGGRWCARGAGRTRLRMLRCGGRCGHW